MGNVCAIANCTERACAGVCHTCVVYCRGACASAEPLRINLGYIMVLVVQALVAELSCKQKLSACSILREYSSQLLRSY